MDKLERKPFSEVTNYIQLREVMPAVFARITDLEDKVNQLIDQANEFNTAKKEVKTPDAAGKDSAQPRGPFLPGSEYTGKVFVGDRKTTNSKGSGDPKLEEE